MSSTTLNRVTEFDYIRVISLFGILLCHSCFEFSELSYLGRFLGLTFNFLFLILSAFLLGIKWNKDNYISYNHSFFLQRMVKLASAYYPYLVILFFLLYITNNPDFAIRHIISHSLFLPWFDKIPDAGHLWFMTMIAICYFGCVLSSKYLRFTNLRILIGGGISLLLDFIASKYNLPGYVFPYLWGYLIVFRFANSILDYIRRCKIGIITICTAIVTFGAICFFFADGFIKHNFEAYIIGMISACMIFAFLFKILHGIRSSRIVLYLSFISFEIYLVHEFFLGKYSVYKLPFHPLLNFFIFIICAIFAGIVLNKISSLLKILNLKLLQKRI